MVATTMRDAGLDDLAALLKDQHAAKVDVVAPALALRMEGGVLRVAGAEPVVSEDGVTIADGLYLPTAVFDEGVADKLKIPVGYLRRMRSERLDLYDANINGWLHGHAAANAGYVGEGDYPSPHDPRSFLIRCFTGGTSGLGVARAMLSDKYARIDNFDVLTAALAGVKATGTQVTVEGCDLTERRMYVRIVAPEVTALAPTLLRNYRSPFRDPDVAAQRGGGMRLDNARALAGREGLGYDVGDEPIVWAGLVITNSETGNGAWTLTPRLVVRVCKNGLTVNVDALRSVHLGAKMDEGIVKWTEDTQRKQLALITAKARDAVATFLDEDYVISVIGRIEAQSEAPVRDAVQTVTNVGKKLSFDQETIDGVLDHFIRGGDTTAGGLMSAVTSYAQVIGDPDKAHEVESAGMRALELAAAAA